MGSRCLADSPLRIIQLTPGAGGMFCGGCLRDNALTAALTRQGHDVLLLPLYMPLTLDEADHSQRRIFFGGVNVYLQQKNRLFRRAPRWLNRLLDHRGLLKFAGRFAAKTSPHELGDLTLSMLRGEDGRQAGELDKLLEFLRGQPKPDVVVLSNALLAGMTRRIRESLGVPVVSTLQGEDFFLDGLPADAREKAWHLLRERAKDCSGFVAVSRYYADVMTRRLGLDPQRVHVVLNGINLEGYAPQPAPPTVPTVGYLARMSPEKGLQTLIDGFRLLLDRNRVPGVRLKIGGSLIAADARFVAEMRRELDRQKIAPRVTFHPNLSRAEKINFLQSLSVLSVPATYGEAFGLYVLEALACGVPVVQPRHGAFPEILERTGGGLLYTPGDSADLAEKLETLLLDEPGRIALGAGGRGQVLAQFNITQTASNAADVLRKIILAGTV
jgi:glycosyltransferase involved in cell wall biosynthesis